MRCEVEGEIETNIILRANQSILYPSWTATDPPLTTVVECTTEVNVACLCIPEEDQGRVTSPIREIHLTIHLTSPPDLHSPYIQSIKYMAHRVGKARCDSWHGHMSRGNFLRSALVFSDRERV